MPLADGELRGLLLLADLHAVLAPGAKAATLGRVQQVRGRARNGDQPLFLSASTVGRLFKSAWV